MRILIVVSHPVDRLRSIALYAEWLMHLFETHGHTVDMLGPQPVFANLWPGGAVRKYLAYLDKHLLFPSLLRVAQQRFDFVILPDQGYAMYARELRGVPYFVTCHDVNSIRAARGEFPQVHIGWLGRLQQRWILSGLCAAEEVVCVSQHTATELARLGRAPERRTAIIHNALNYPYQPGQALSEELLRSFGDRAGHPYLLCLGGGSWYKNRVAALRILARLAEKDGFADLSLVMAGRPLNREMRSVIEEEKIGARVIEMVDVGAEDLEALYCNAAALLFPSLAEGFGWPVLEAQACGCPVIASERAPMTEIAGDAAIFIDPLDPAAAAAAIVRQWGRLEELRQLGFANLKRFECSRIEAQYLELCERILRTRKSLRQAHAPAHLTHKKSIP
jgi:glycosyltransferase involved in cell wall biosynthesis